MDDGKSIDETAGYLRLAVPLMSQHGIPMTPRNYSTWYMYVSGGDGELAQAIEAILEAGEKFTEKQNEELYLRFCAGKDEKALRKIRADLQEVLRAILKEVTELTGQTEEYESFVSNSVNMLSDEASIQEIRRVISEIIDKTRTLGRFGKNTRHKLKETTEALEMLRRDFEQARTEASVDFLTGVANRKAFESTLAASIREAATLNDPLSLLLIDIDLFKRFNDEFGHLIGDEVLRFTDRKIREMVKGTDFVARFGGEEFAVLLPRTPLAGAAHVAETIRAFFAQATLETKATSKSLGTITVSIGVACHRPPESPEDFVRRSDEALYFAKKNGKNRLATEAHVEARSGQTNPPLEK
jgi:diguanylate cyclase